MDDIGKMICHFFPRRLKLNSDRICSDAGVSSDAAATQQTQLVRTSGLSTDASWIPQGGGLSCPDFHRALRTTLAVRTLFRRRRARFVVIVVFSLRLRHV